MTAAGKGNKERERGKCKSYSDRGVFRSANIAKTSCMTKDAALPSPPSLVRDEVPRFRGGGGSVTRRTCTGSLLLLGKRKPAAWASFGRAFAPPRLVSMHT